MFRLKSPRYNSKPFLLRAAIRKFGILAALGFLMIVGFIGLVRYQLEPAFRADIYENLHASFSNVEPVLVTAFLQGDADKANLVVSDDSFLPSASFKEVFLRSGFGPPEFNCGSSLEKLAWGTFCHENSSLRAMIPIRSADQLLGWLRIEQDASMKDWLPYVRIIQAIWIASLSLLLLALLFVLQFLRSTILPLRRAIEDLGRVETAEDFDSVIKDLPFSELIGLATRLASRSRELTETKTALEEAELRAQSAHLASQVAHDLQSPVAALKQVAGNIDRLATDDVVRSIKTSARRIDQISRDILCHFQVDGKSQRPGVTFVFPVIQTIVDEIKLAKSAGKIEIECNISDHLMGTWTSLSESDLGRCLSNLVNNSIDAIRRKGMGSVQLSVAETANEMLIVIEDTGLGMKPEDLNKVRIEGGTLHEGGHGLGLSFVKDALESIGGQLRIDSTWMEGTKTTLHLPKVSRPSWFIDRLEIPSGSKIVVIDDDESILGVWKLKLIGMNASFHSRIPESFDCDFLIIDHEIRGEKETGAEVIERLQLGQKAILSTSYFFSASIQRKVEDLGCYLLPKFLLGNFDFQVKAGEGSEEDLDLVLIDDDPICRSTWELLAGANGKRILTFSSHFEFLEKPFSLSTPVYVDKNLSDGQSGYTVLMELHQKGYRNLYLTTGEVREDKAPPEYVIAVVSKEFPLAA
ncbi:MAG: sensor histidine kinase [Bradymonadales bacterium]|nr:MAG: sensor histidine kinase [Bradymonadales bacterium]